MCRQQTPNPQGGRANERSNAKTHTDLQELDERAALVEAGGVHDDVLLHGAGDDAHGAVLEHLVQVLVQVLGLFFGSD